MSTANAKNKNNIGAGWRNLSRTTRILLTVLTCIVIAVCIVVPVCVVTLIDSVSIAPSFESFDQSTDYSITVVWNQIKKAEKYVYQYSFEEPSAKSAVTEETKNTRFTVERQKGTFYFRVKAIKDGNGEYSEWISKEIDGWTLSKTVITVSDSYKVSWVPVTYRYYTDNTNTVPAYYYSFAVNGVWSDVQSTQTASVDLYDYIEQIFTGTKNAYREYYLGNTTEWPGDLTLEIKVWACNHDFFGTVGYVQPNREETALYHVYEEKGEPATKSIVITQEVFDAFPDR